VALLADELGPRPFEAQLIIENVRRIMSGYYRDSSIIRRVHREHVVGLSGPRALLMQAAHPVAFAGFFVSTGALDDPYPRLARTAAVINAVVFGERVEADEATRRVRAVHARTRGRLIESAGRFPAGTQWAADDPDLLLWVIATLADSGLLVYERYVGALQRAQREAYWQDYRVMGELFGLAAARMPTNINEFESYMHDMLASDVLSVDEQARRLAIQIVLHPPVPVVHRPLLELANFITVGLLPARLRRQYGLRWDPLRGLAVRLGAEYTKHLLIPLLPGRVRYRMQPSTS
jgi:uncharacterized protein (DUF2236 family)